MSFVDCASRRRQRRGRRNPVQVMVGSASWFRPSGQSRSHEMEETRRSRSVSDLEMCEVRGLAVVSMQLRPPIDLTTAAAQETLGHNAANPIRQGASTANIYCMRKELPLPSNSQLPYQHEPTNHTDQSFESWLYNTSRFADQPATLDNRCQVENMSNR